MQGDIDELKDKFWAIGGGKGGVGKSVVTLMLGTALARQGKKVILVDADLGGSNLHTLVGIRYPLYTLADFITRQVDSIDQVIIDTPVTNMKLISGADDILGIANPKSAQKIRVFNHLKKLDADFILLDLGAGTSFTSMDFFLYAPNKIIVLTPQATSIQNAYGFLKSSLYRRLAQVFSKDPQELELIKRIYSPVAEDRIESIEKLKESFESLSDSSQSALTKCLKELNVNLIVNMVRYNKEKDVGNIVKDVAMNYLSLELGILGVSEYDKILGMSINNLETFLTENRDSVSNVCFYDMASVLIKNSQKQSRLINSF